jgi:hypothetical protein
MAHILMICPIFFFAFAKMLFDLQLRNGSKFLLFWFGVVKGGDLVQVESFNNFEGFCILKTTLAFGVWVHFFFLSGN